MKKFISLSIIFILCQIAFGQKISSNTNYQNHSIQFNKKNAISLELLGLRLGSAGLKYERSLSERKSLIVKGGIIGLWEAKPLNMPFGSEWNSSYNNIDEQTNSTIDLTGFGEITGDHIVLNEKTKDKGFYLSVGPKWRLGNPAKASGFYFHPSISYSRFTHNLSYQWTINPYDTSLPSELTTYSERVKKMNSIAAMASLGFQARAFEILVIDLNAGLGYAQNLDFTKSTTKSFAQDSPVFSEAPATGEYLVRFSHGAIGSSGVSSAIAVHVGLSIGVEF